MLPIRARVSRGGNNDNPVTDGFLGSLIDYASRTGNVFVSTQRNVQDSNIEALAVRGHPFDALRNIVFGDSSPGTGLNQNELGIGCQPAIYTVAQSTVTGSDD